MTHRTLLPLAGLTCAAAAFAHYTWIATAPALLVVGKPATVQINHGHKFPVSEEAINAKQVDLFVVTPRGGKVKLEPAPGGSSVKAQFTPKDAGVYTIAFTQDRGISSRTPAGVKPGGRDNNPGAAQTYRNVRTAVVYAATSKQSSLTGKPSGVDFELTGSLSNGAWNLQLTKTGKPVPGAAVEVFLTGEPKARPVGTTGVDGRITFKPAAGEKGPAMFSTTFREPAPTGAPYDFTNYGTSLYVSW